MNRSYCVVGGGISGLAAAYRLRTALGADADIALFDPSDRLGGVLRTERVAGQPMDVGAEAFVRRRPEVPALLAELGLADRQLTTTGVRPLIYSQQRLHPLPSSAVHGIPSSGRSVAGLVDDATVACIDGEPQRGLDWHTGHDPAVADLVSERFGGQVVARSVDPMLAGVYAGSATTIGLRSAAPGLAGALDDGAASLTDAVRRTLPPAGGAPVFGAVAGGYAVLIDELVARGRPRWVQAAVESIADGADGWSLHDTAGGAWHADAVIVAVPAPQAARLTADAAPIAAAAADRIESASSAVVALAVPAGTALPDQSGVLIAAGEPTRAKAVTLSSRKWATWGRDGDAELLRVSFGRFGDDPARSAVAASDDELVDWAVADLAALFGVEVDPLDARVRRWIAAMPQYRPGHAGVIAELRANLPPTMAVAGSYLGGIGVPACIAAADDAVATVLRASGVH